jgi:hypothetical protein
VLLLGLAGCVSKPVEVEEHAPPLMIAQNSDGKVTLSWESNPDHIYTVYYQAKKESDWKALRTGYQVRGTGQTITIYDRVNPNWPLRRYRLLPESI